MSIGLSDASAIVTGGASGLGLAAVRVLLEAGAQVVVVDLPDEASSGRADTVVALGARARFAPAT
ncbi:SDR family NAD(P)-dependent oxidoreductase [Aeromicrobium sp. PE09-221]|uniref:SDR family NAD(P)-dependent oxidoreductase n=1 Tax=Aeromicrobium sp. PE09-221 TaxID=1898043 RepID=UPI001F1669AC|nr:SDR family NAD(P)-dependent oxidoreductase [Aeromicrobium sp. PE09-221]